MKFKKYAIQKYITLILLVIMGACDTEFVNPNNPTEEQILSSREGLFGLAVGLRQIYSTDGLRFSLEAPAVTTREAAAFITLVQYVELENGAGDLLNTNAHVAGLWGNMLQIMAMSEKIIIAADNVPLEAGTSSGLKATAKFFKAISIGALSQNFEQVVINTSTDNAAEFVPRAQGYQEAIDLLTSARSDLSANGLSDEFIAASILGGIDLSNSIEAYLARYQLFNGDYDAAINSASNVDVSVRSEFIYDNINPNPIFGTGANNIKPRDDFGFMTFAGDGRIDFYLSPSDEENANGLDVEDFNAVSFFGNANASIPVYLPGEMQLIIAEANVRKSSQNLAAAIAALDVIRTKNDDIYGVNANLTAYAGPVTTDDLLLEIYQNRRAELFLTGVSLEDSRRFDRPQPTNAAQTFSDERNRNFYPYPTQERLNNSSTPPDPAI